MTVPVVTINIADQGSNAAATLPQQNVQILLGVSSAGTVNLPVATTNPATLVSNLGYGPLVEAAGLVVDAGGIAVAVKLPTVAHGTATAVVATTTNGSTSVVTVTLDGTTGAFDDYLVMYKPVTGGTIGTTGIQFQISLDAGRTFGPILALGTATTYAIPNTGITLNFAAGTMVVGDYWRFSTTAPTWNDAGVQSAINSLAGGQYGVAGWGSMQLVGVSTASNITNLQSYLASIQTNLDVYSRCIASARDALVPTAWGGSGESQTTWVNSLTTNFASVSANRVTVCAGYYNTPTVFPNAAAGTPSYRRSLACSDGARRVQIPPQRKAGAVSDGAFATIFVNPAVDPGDGFVYYDSRTDPTLDGARFQTAKTWPKKQAGFYSCQENLMSVQGSQFLWLVLGNVIDVACDIAYAAGVEEVESDLRLTSTGTLFPTDALTLQEQINLALAAGMINVGMVSDAYCIVDQQWNVRDTSNIPITLTVVPRGYADSLTFTINLST